MLQADSLKVAPELLKFVAGVATGWFLHVAKEWHFRKGLRDALYEELADNYSAIRFNVKKSDFQWLRANLNHELAFHAYHKASGNPEAFYRISEHGWFERCFKELEKCKSLSADDHGLFEQLKTVLGTIESIAPPADTELFRSKLPIHYANEIK
jgi:hypothetical protein